MNLSLSVESPMELAVFNYNKDLVSKRYNGGLPERFADPENSIDRSRIRLESMKESFYSIEEIELIENFIDQITRNQKDFDYISSFGKVATFSMISRDLVIYYDEHYRSFENKKLLPLRMKAYEVVGNFLKAEETL